MGEELRRRMIEKLASREAQEMESAIKQKLESYKSERIFWVGLLGAGEPWSAVA